jgi:hypothetical protein
VGCPGVEAAAHDTLCCGGVVWEVELAENGLQRGTAELAMTPLLKELAEPRVPQVRSWECRGLGA